MKTNSKKSKATPEKNPSMNGLNSADTKLVSRRNKRWKAEDRRTEALRRMEIDESQLAKMPPISDILGEANISTQQVIKAMRFSDDPLIIQFFDTYDSLPLGDRDRVSLEAILLKANINPVHFLGSMQLSLREHSLGMMKLIAIANQPNIMQKTVEYAELPGGYRDREQFHTMTGALPSPKGVTVFQKFTNVTPVSEQKQEPIQEAEVVETDLNYIFPDSSRMQDKLSPIRQKQLESGK